MKLILGGPGCGKTTRLLDIVQKELEAGVPADEVAFVAFTKAAAQEARQRAAERFGLDPEEDLPWFRTIHSLVYKTMVLTSSDIMDSDNWEEFAELIGEPITGHFTRDSTISPNDTTGDQLLRVCDFAATTMSSLRAAWEEIGEGIDWHHLLRFDSALANFKANLVKLDFTDMLLNFASEDLRVPVRVAIIDEAQDLTAAQWAVVNSAFKGAERVYVGGDDDQAIYRWAGADVEKFLNLSSSPEVLALSYRLSPPVHAIGQRIARQIRHRYDKPYAPSAKWGRVDWHQNIEWIPFSDFSDNWLILARNKYLLKDVERMLLTRGVPFASREGDATSPEEVEAISVWSALHQRVREDVSAAEARLIFKAMGRVRPALKELTRHTPESLKFDIGMNWYEALSGIPLWKRDYYVACMRNGYDLRAEPGVKVDTIHGVKGLEAPNVAIITDYSRRTASGYERDPDHEHRVFYVGVTRAINTLHIVAPQTATSYPGLIS